MIRLSEFYFIRHGQTDPHEDDSHIGLNSQGLLQAHQQKELIQQLPLRTVCSSPFKRAIETAKIVTNASGIKVIDSLRECTASTWNSMTTSQQPCLLTHACRKDTI